MKGMEDLVGRRFGRLTPIACEKINGFVYWLCACDCGAKARVCGYKLRHGHTRSCGCLKKDILLERNHVHGLTGTAEYHAWAAMHGRCYNRNNEAYKDYGGRGIKVAPEWSTFTAFLKDMGKRPSPKHSLDRVDNDGDYGPRNCRWATKQKQNNNRRSNRWLELGGSVLTCAEWERSSGLKRGTLYHRLRAGWSAERAVKTPLRGGA